MKAIFASVLFALVAAQSATAGTIPFHASQCYPAATSGATKEGPSDESGSPTAPTVRLDFPDGSTTTAYCVFQIPPSYPSTDDCTGSGTPYACCTGTDTGCTGIVDIALTHYQASGSGAVYFTTSVGCHPNDGVTSSTAPGVIDLTTGAQSWAATSIAYPSVETVYDDGDINDSDAATLYPSYGGQCLVKITRNGAHGSDTSTVTTTVEGGLISYYPDN